MAGFDELFVTFCWWTPLRVPADPPPPAQLLLRVNFLGVALACRLLCAADRCW